MTEDKRGFVGETQAKRTGETAGQTPGVRTEGKRRRTGETQEDRFGETAGQASEARTEWARARDVLVAQTEALGYPPELGMLLAKELGSPRAMHRLTVYLREVKPKSEEEIVDELLAIKSDVDTWRDKKAAREASARVNELKYFGLDEL